MFGWGYVQRYFNNRNRALFKYWDGIRWRAVDPLVALRKIADHPKLTTDHLKMLENPQGLPEGLAIEAFDTVLVATRDVFNVREWTENRKGLTQAQTRDLLSQFMGYISLLKKSGNNQQIMPEPMEPNPSTGKSPSPNIPNATLDSPSMLPESIPEIHPEPFSRSPLR